MRGRRGIAIFIGVAGFLLVLIIVLVLILQSNQGAPLPPPVVQNGEEQVDDEGRPVIPVQQFPTVDPQAQLVDVVVSLQTLQRGWRMTEDVLAIDRRLAANVGPNVITNIDDAIGLYARTNIYQGETLTTDLVVRDPTLVGVDDYGPSSLIPQGWLAMAVPLDRLSGVAYGLSAGDSVDIMMSFILLELDEQFQTLMRNSASFILETRSEDGSEGTRIVYLIEPFGRFESLPNGDIAHIFPSESQRPVAVSMVVQGARVIQVGPWVPPRPPQPPTPIPDPNDPTPTPGAEPPTPTPEPPAVVVIAMPPQQQLILKWALESDADVDFALRSASDNQLQVYAVENVDLNYILSRFNISFPPNFNYTVRSVATPQAAPEP
jgi:Flp pilus assembly protein CpaB